MGSLEPKTGAQNLSSVEGREVSQNALAVMAVTRSIAARIHQRVRIGAWATRGWGVGSCGVEARPLSGSGMGGGTEEWGHSKWGM